MIAEGLHARVSDVAERDDPAALAMARLCLLDWLGVTIAGAREPVVEILAADVAGSALPLLGRDGRAGLRDWTLVCGTAGHALDYDDGHSAMRGHPAVAVIPPLLALAAERRLPWERLMRGIVAGYEAAGRIGSMMGPNHYERGFHATGTVGAVAATIAGAWLIGLDAGRAHQALGLAGTRAAGLKASFGSDAKPLHAGWASLIALTSLQWAERGMSGAGDILGAPQGIGAAASTTFDAARGLEQRSLPHIFDTVFKHHAACGVTHPAIRAALALRAKLNGRVPAAVRIDVSPLAEDICNVAAPETGLALKFSLRGTVAMALLGIDTADPASYAAATCRRADLRALVERSEVRLEQGRALGPIRVEITCEGGERLVGDDPGSEGRGAGGERGGLAAKFLALTRPVVCEGGASALLEAVLQGEPIPAELLTMCRIREEALP